MELLSIIIPVFNEVATIEQVILKVLSVDFGVPCEIIIIDDGSTDGTRELLLQKNWPRTRLLLNEKNNGKGYSVRAGFNESKGDILVIQDADLEYDPSQIKELLKPIRAGESKVVYGSRYLGNPKNQSLSFYLGNKALTKVFNMMFGTKLTDMETCYKALARDVLDTITLKSNGFEIEGEITARIAKSGFKIIEIPISYTAREKRLKKIRARDGCKTLLVMLRIALQKG